MQIKRPSSLLLYLVQHARMDEGEGKRERGGVVILPPPFFFRVRFGSVPSNNKIGYVRPEFSFLPLLSFRGSVRRREFYPSLLPPLSTSKITGLGWCVVVMPVCCTRVCVCHFTRLDDHTEQRQLCYGSSYRNTVQSHHITCTGIALIEL